MTAVFLVNDACLRSPFYGCTCKEQGKYRPGSIDCLGFLFQIGQPALDVYGGDEVRLHGQDVGKGRGPRSLE